MSERLCKISVGLALLAGICAAPAAAQDYTAGKTAAQLFQSDCTACHKSPAGLAKGRDAGALASFLKEHYTTKEETAVALAAYLSGAGPGDAKLRAQAPITGPKAKTRNADGDQEPKPGPKPRVNSAAAEPPSTPADDVDTANPREEPAKRNARAPAAPREGAKSPADAMLAKLKFYGSAGGEAKDTERLANPARKLESYANSGSPADAVTPAEGGGAAATAADANAKRKAAADKKKKNADAATAAHGPRPHRTQAPIIQPPPGNN